MELPHVGWIKSYWTEPNCVSPFHSHACSTVAQKTTNKSAKLEIINNNSYIALYPVKIYELVSLYIINIKLRLTANNNNKKKVQVL